ncbi:MAG: hypothetical protein HY297_05925 [Thaumarchaeota archaeon]|nr:hypothetical protein [Nitrososphaerota archaeon]
MMKPEDGANIVDLLLFGVGFGYNLIVLLGFLSIFLLGPSPWASQVITAIVAPIAGLLPVLGSAYFLFPLLLLVVWLVLPGIIMMLLLHLRKRKKLAMLLNALTLVNTAFFLTFFLIVAFLGVGG